jgi:hypothetical protein
LQAGAAIIDFETLAIGTYVGDSYANLGLRAVIESGSAFSSMVISEGMYGVQNFGNSPTHVMHVGEREEPTTLYFVNPSNKFDIIGATSVSMLLGDGNPDTETFSAAFFDVLGNPLGSPQTFTTTTNGLLVGATASELGAYIGSVRFTLLASSQSGVALDDLNYNLAPVPIPATIFLFGTGIAGLTATGLRRRKQ